MIRTEPIDLSASYIAAKRLRIDGKDIQPGSRIPDAFHNRSAEALTRMLRIGTITVDRGVSATPVNTVPETASMPESSDNRVQLDSLSMQALREACKKHGLPSNGTKNELRRRLQERLAV